MIKVVVGDLLEAAEDIIAHQVNCQRKMNSGVAKQIRNKYPSAYDDYMSLTLNEMPEALLGRIIVSRVSTDKFVVHLFGQLAYGYDGKRYTRYDALYDSLSQLKSEAQAAGLSVAIPWKLGSDRGGADWDIVYKMIEKIFDDYEITIYKMEEN